MIDAFLIHDNPDPHKRRIKWPPRIGAADIHAGYRATGIVGIPQRIGVYQVIARLGAHWETLVSVYFGRPRPTATQLRAANARLASARL